MADSVLMRWKGLEWEKSPTASSHDLRVAHSPVGAYQFSDYGGPMAKVVLYQHDPLNGDLPNSLWFQRGEDREALFAAADADCLRRMAEGGLKPVEVNRMTCPVCDGNGSVLMRLGREFVTCVVCSGDKLITVVPSADEETDE
ncbi:hypothetical protein [Alienimonas sp. DA493]|uniref:hypothetical protein n=1 Tax=Alienimonas sp. DA493 TaxID=3373605 RepID=UPI0037545842